MWPISSPSQGPPPYSDSSKATAENQRITEVEREFICSSCQGFFRKDHAHETNQGSWEKLASETPQFRWTNTQCRAWIQAVAIWYLGYDEKLARTAANLFNGFGPTLFAYDVPNWEGLFNENNDEANSVHSLVFSLRNEEGALPKDMTFKSMQ